MNRSKEGFETTQKFVREAREAGAQYTIPRGMTKQEWLTRITLVDMYLANQDESLSSAGRALGINHNQSASNKYRATLMDYWIQSPNHIQNEFPPGSIQNIKLLPEDISIKRAATREYSPAYTLYVGIQDGKTVEQIKAETGQNFPADTRRIVRKWGADIPLSPLEDARLRNEAIGLALDTAVTPDDYRDAYQYISWTYLTHNMVGENARFVAFSTAIEEVHGVSTLLKESSAGEIEGLLVENDIPFIVREYMQPGRQVLNKVRAISRDHIDLFGEVTKQTYGRSDVKIEAGKVVSIY
ncbi:MAG TPA: hypothetical protein VHE53_01775 [Patescibacteria group bacterium]|nr:hypothetical protein [Patescibacteria group bacterium]